MFARIVERARGKTQPEDLLQYFDADKIDWPLLARNRTPGDRFHPLGARGAKKLKDVLIDEKIPAALRERMVVLCDRKRPVWVAGVRTGHRARLTDDTQTVARVQIVVAPGG
jgi:tRNA(Ile)-lysidine synthase